MLPQHLSGGSTGSFGFLIFNSWISYLSPFQRKGHHSVFFNMFIELQPSPQLVAFDHPKRKTGHKHHASSLPLPQPLSKSLIYFLPSRATFSECFIEMESGKM
jgi:hypothetical protein